MIRAIRYAKKYTSGYSSLANRDYQDAYQSFLDCYQVLGSKKSKLSRFFPLDIMMGEVLFELGKADDAIKRLGIAKVKLANNGALSSLDQKYLISYCNILLKKWEVCKLNRGSFIREGEAKFVKTKYRRRFPISF